MPSEDAGGVYESLAHSNEPETNVYEPLGSSHVQASTKVESTTSEVQATMQHLAYTGGQRKSLYAAPTHTVVISELANALKKRKKEAEDLKGGVPAEDIPIKPGKRPDADNPKVAKAQWIVKFKPGNQEPLFPEKSNQASFPPPDTKISYAITMTATNSPQASVKTPSDTNKPSRPIKRWTLPVHKAPEQEAVPPSPTNTGQARSSTTAAATRGQISKASPIQPPGDASMYINQSQMAVVGPTQHTKFAKPSGQDLPPSKDPARKQSLDRQAALSAKQDRPQTGTLDTMTVEDVKELLTKLNLAHHHKQFEENQVDGLLLRDLDAVTLKDDFGMTRTETMRLRNFVKKGHLPK